MSIINGKRLLEKFKDQNLISEAIKAAREFRRLSIERAKYSLKNITENTYLPLEKWCEKNDIPDSEFIEYVLKESRETEEAPYGRNKLGLPYLNQAHLKKKDREITERGRFGMRGDVDKDDEFEIEDDLDDTEMDDDQSNFADDIIDERVNKNKSLLRTPTSAPALVSSGVGSVKLSEKERQILIKNLKQRSNIKENHQIKERKDDKEFLRSRAGIRSEGNAKKVVRDLEIKEHLKK